MVQPHPLSAAVATASSQVLAFKTLYGACNASTDPFVQPSKDNAKSRRLGSVGGLYIPDFFSISLVALVRNRDAS